MVVHRKGATPAAKGVLGIVPGSMCTAAFVVRGKGNVHSLHSCSHGAGRLMSRSAALQSLQPSEVRAFLQKQGIKLLSGGLDEAPQAYKDIQAGMAEQRGLVHEVALFIPREVKMAHGPLERKVDSHDQKKWRRKK